MCAVSFIASDDAGKQEESAVNAVSTASGLAAEQ